MSIPGQQGSERVRIWRALKGLGTAVLRDGVYLAPASDRMRTALDEQRDAIRGLGGRAHLFTGSNAEAGEAEEFALLFDRGDDYTALITRVSALGDELIDIGEAEARRRQAQLRRELETIRRIDFFPARGAKDAAAALTALDHAINARFSPDEPAAAPGQPARVDKRDFLGRVWATRKNIWVDRAASAWLIRRFVDPDARFLWLEKPSDCPKDAVGFDFDGAEFSHLGERVTFEVLVHCFRLENDSALVRLGRLVNYLDVGGIPVPEAGGFVAMLSGARQRCRDDDELMSHAGTMLDFLYEAYAANGPDRS